MTRCFSTSSTFMHQSNNQENNNISSSHHHSKSHTVVKPPEPRLHSFEGLQPNATNLTQYNTVNRSPRVKHHIYTETDERDSFSSKNGDLAESARTLTQKNPQDAINIIKTSCALDSNGRIDILHLLSQERGIDVLWRLHQAYSEIGNLEEMKHIYLTVAAQQNIDSMSKNMFKQEFVTCYSKNGNFKVAFQLLNDLPISRKWIYLFVDTSNEILKRNVEDVYLIIKYLSQCIDNRMEEIKKKIHNPELLEQYTRNITHEDSKITTNSQHTYHSLESSLRKIKLFFETFGLESRFIQFSLMIAEAYSSLGEQAIVETIFKFSLDTKKSEKRLNETVKSRKLKTLAMQSLIYQNRHQDAISLFFDKTIPSDNSSFEQLMKACIESGQMDFAIFLYNKYITNPTLGIYVELIKAYILKGSFQKAEELMKEFLEVTTIPEHRKMVLKTLLIRTYAQNGLIHQAQKLFDIITRPDTQCCNELMKAYCHMGDSVKVREIFMNISEKDATSYLYLLESYIIDSNSVSALKAYEQIPEPASIHADAVIRTILKDVNFGGLGQALQFFYTLENPSLSTQKHILRALAKFGTKNQVDEFLQGIPNPDTECFSCLLLHILKHDSADIESAQKVFAMIPNPDGICYGYMICIYGKAGDLDMVNQLFQEFPSTFTIQAYTNAYISNNKSKELLEQFPQLITKYPRCFNTNDAYLSAIRDSITHRNPYSALEFFDIYMAHAKIKFAHDFVSILEFVGTGGDVAKFRKMQPLVQKIWEALPKCIATPNVRSKVENLASQIMEILKES